MGYVGCGCWAGEGWLNGDVIIMRCWCHCEYYRRYELVGEVTGLSMRFHSLGIMKTFVKYLSGTPKTKNTET